MARRRNRLGRFVKGAGRRAARGARKLAKRGGSFLRLGGRGGPGPFGILHRPVSRGVAPALGLGALLYLIFNPLPNGDSWLTRSIGAVLAFRNGETSMATYIDPAGNHPGSILAQQIIQNAFTATLIGIGAGVTAWFGRKLGV